MNLIEQLNEHQYFYLAEIGEPEANQLRIIILEAKISDKTEDIDLGVAKISDVHPIVTDETSRAYEIIFESYIGYSVRNESYVGWDESEEFTGKLFRVYTKSHFLDYIQVSAVYASEDDPGKFTHYEVVCLEHVIDVASMDEPRISILRRA